jgi:hypothetical protein
MLMVSSGSTATLVRLYFLSRQGDISSDFFFIITDVFMWSIIEPGIGLTAASIACLRPLFRKFLSSTSQNNAPRTPYFKSCSQRFQFSTTHFRSRIYNGKARIGPPLNGAANLGVPNANGDYNSHFNRALDTSMLSQPLGLEATRVQTRGSDGGMSGAKWIDDSSEEIPTSPSNYKWETRPTNAVDAKRPGRQ